MGYDASNYLLAGVDPDDVRDYLELLGYRRTARDSFWYFRERGYEHFSGIGAWVSRDDTNQVSVSTRTNIWCSWTDLEVHNSTIRRLRKRFGGYFHSDYGRNRYFPNDKLHRQGAEAGWYYSWFRIHNSFAALSSYVHTIERAKGALPPAEHVDFLGTMHPLVLFANVFLPYLVAVIEDYFKSLYVALLEFSDRRDDVLRGSRLNAEDLISVARGEMTVEAAVARTMSFQNISKICKSFQTLDPKPDLAGALKKPYRRRRESLYGTFDRVFNQRHALVHRNELAPTYLLDDAERDLRSVEAGLKRVQLVIAARHGWDVSDIY